MIVLRLIPVVLSLLVLAAHFLRAGGIVAVLFVFVTLGLLFVRKRWAAWWVQTVLVVGALEWVRTLFVLYFARQEAGEPWVRMVVILGVVALVTLGSAFVFLLPAMKDRYGDSAAPATVEPSI